MILHLARRVALTTLLIACLVGGVTGAAVHLDPRLWSQLDLRAIVWFMVGIALTTAPLSAFLSASWSWLSLRHSGQLALFEAGGHRPGRLRLFMLTAVALVLGSAAVATEVLLPHGRSSAGARLSWELQGRGTTAFFADEDRLVVRAGASLDHLTDVWRWREDVPVHLRDVRWDGATWTEAGAPVWGLPSPLQLVAARPALFELLTVSELVTLGATVRWKERLVRPLFWFLWIACALAALSRWALGAAPEVLALGFFLVAGVTLQGLSAELAFGASTVLGQWMALAAAPALAALLAGAVRWLKVAPQEPVL